MSSLLALAEEFRRNRDTRFIQRIRAGNIPGSMKPMLVHMLSDEQGHSTAADGLTLKWLGNGGLGTTMLGEVNTDDHHVASHLIRQARLIPTREWITQDGRLMPIKHFDDISFGINTTGGQIFMIELGHTPNDDKIFPTNELHAPARRKLQEALRENSRMASDTITIDGMRIAPLYCANDLKILRDRANAPAAEPEEP